MSKNRRVATKGPVLKNVPIKDRPNMPTLRSLPVHYNYLKDLARYRRDNYDISVIIIPSPWLCFTIDYSGLATKHSHILFIYTHFTPMF